jgi:hypothetical protein
MPCNYKRDYPANWKTEIVPRIKARDGYCCKFCQLPEGQWGYYDSAGQWHKVEGPDSDTAILDDYKVIVVQLGVAHLDHLLVDHGDDNLAALCRRCHIRYDAPISAPKAAATRKYGPPSARSPKSLFEQE